MIRLPSFEHEKYEYYYSAIKKTLTVSARGLERNTCCRELALLKFASPKRSNIYQGIWTSHTVRPSSAQQISILSRCPLNVPPWWRMMLLRFTSNFVIFRLEKSPNCSWILNSNPDHCEAVKDQKIPTHSTPSHPATALHRDPRTILWFFQGSIESNLGKMTISLVDPKHWILIETITHTSLLGWILAGGTFHETDNLFSASAASALAGKGVLFKWVVRWLLDGLHVC